MCIADPYFMGSPAEFKGRIEECILDSDNIK
jgi:hypothetical protein